MLAAARLHSAITVARNAPSARRCMPTASHQAEGSFSTQKLKKLNPARWNWSWFCSRQEQRLLSNFAFARTPNGATIPSVLASYSGMPWFGTAIGEPKKEDYG